MDLEQQLNVTEKLEYLGLDLDKEEPIFKYYKPLDFRPDRNYKENSYKVYKYVKIKDIKIYITTTHRTEEIIAKYSKAVPVHSYLYPKDDEDIQRHTMFLSMLKSVQIDEIEKISTEQEKINRKIPFKVKYDRNYLWQIYYSEYTNQYFMLLATEELNYSAFFYLLKKQLENSDDSIFVPISYLDYSMEYLTKSEISDLENYLWYFTKNWPMTYEVYNKKEDLSLQIVGETYIYDKLQSDYKIEIKNREDAIKFYKLLKAIFILQTELPHYYTFDVNIGNSGNLEFKFKSKKITYDTITNTIKNEYIRISNEAICLLKNKDQLEESLTKTQSQTKKLEAEFITREKQIALYLECKKTFFGKVKYFFSKKTIKITEIKMDNDQYTKANIEKEKIEEKIFYSLEDLIEKYKEFDRISNAIKNLKLDIEAGENKNLKLESKIKNAKLYLDEINKHKKSIFEFWKFTNKDVDNALPQGKDIETVQFKKIKAVFDYDLDFEELSKKLDKKQREYYTRSELNSIFILTTPVIKDVNKLINNKEINLDNINQLVKETIKNNSLLRQEDYEVFAGISMSNGLKTLNNKKHRENNREILTALELRKNVTLNEYKEKLEKIIEDTNSAIEKVKIPYEISGYKIAEGVTLEIGFNFLNMNLQNEINTELSNYEKELSLIKINITEKTPIIGLTNIIYYENVYKTLPLGMNVSTRILLNSEKVILKFKNKDTFNIVEEEELGCKIKKIKLFEYDVKQLEEK